LNVKTKRTS